MTNSLFRRPSQTSVGDAKKLAPLENGAAMSLAHLHRDRCDRLKAWLTANAIVAPDTECTEYKALKDYLLKNGIVKYHALELDETAPFALGVDFFGTTFETVVDTLPSE